MAKRSITIVMPTLQRPSDLTVAARSVFAQTMLEKADCTLLIIDNSPEGSAERAVEQLRREAPESLRFVSVREPLVGVANARNCGMEHVQTDLVAFLDDDQVATDQQWLERLYRLQAELGAAVIFGPVKAVIPQSIKAHRNYFEAFFSRTSGFERGLIDDHFGAGNSLVDMAQLPKQSPLFDPAMNETGGEDDLLFLEMASLGSRFGWEPDAVVEERVAAHRARLGYTLKRTFAYGQGPTFRAVMDRKYHLLLLWMLVGFAMFLCYGLLAIAGFVMRFENRANYLDKAVRGLGKVFFSYRFKFYGSSALKKIEQ